MADSPFGLGELNPLHAYSIGSQTSARSEAPAGLVKTDNGLHTQFLIR